MRPELPSSVSSPVAYSTHGFEEGAYPREDWILSPGRGTARGPRGHQAQIPAQGEQENYSRNDYVVPQATAGEGPPRVGPGNRDPPSWRGRDGNQALPRQPASPGQPLGFAVSLHLNSGSSTVCSQNNDFNWRCQKSQRSPRAIIVINSKCVLRE